MKIYIFGIFNFNLKKLIINCRLNYLNRLFLSSKKKGGVNYRDNNSIIISITLFIFIYNII